MVGVPAGVAEEPVAEPVTEEHRPAIRVEYFTDPLCCWSWALEPVWRQLRQQYGSALGWECVLGGMIESWTAFRDPLNDIGRPPQLAPFWHMAGRTTGVRIDPGIWHVDPPASSYPASVAVKAAGLQGGEAGEQYLYLVREAVMTRRLNVARPAVLLQLAAELAIQMPRAFDQQKFAEDLTGSAAADAFTADLLRTRALGVGRFPTVIVHGARGSRIAVGWRPLEVMDEILRSVSADASAPGAGGENAG